MTKLYRYNVKIASIICAVATTALTITNLVLILVIHLLIIISMTSTFDTSNTTTAVPTTIISMIITSITAIIMCSWTANTTGYGWSGLDCLWKEQEEKEEKKWKQ